MKKKKVYISGKISGLKRADYLAIFHKAEMLLVNEGYWVVNPCRFAPCKYMWLYKLIGYRLTILYDLWRLSHCDLIYKIPGYKESKGAMIEGCWAYHFKIWQLPLPHRIKIDKKMAKYITKRKEAKENDEQVLQPVQ